MRVRDAYVSLLGASTPSALAPHLGNRRLWDMGWWTRVALLTPDTRFPEWKEPVFGGDPSQLMTVLRNLEALLGSTTFPTPPEAHVVTLTDAAHQDWKGYARALTHTMLRDGVVDMNLWGAYGRFPEMVLKVATLLAALDWPAGLNSPRIERHQMARAFCLVESWRESLHRVVDLGHEVDTMQILHDIRGIIAGSGAAGVSFRDICLGKGNTSQPQIRSALQRLLDEGTVLCLRAQTGPQGGRPTDRFVLAGQTSG